MKKRIRMMMMMKMKTGMGLMMGRLVLPLMMYH
jgi:hypothetical protein